MPSSFVQASLKALALAATLALQAPAQAGFVTGTWDPPFGPALPGMSWAVRVEVLLPDNACANFDGVRGITGPCADARIQAAFLRLYDTAFGPPDWSQPGTYLSSPWQAATFAACDSSVLGNPAYTTRCFGNFGNFFHLSQLRFDNGSLVGLDALVLTQFITSVGINSLPSSALNNEFSLAFGLNGPQVTCVTCPGGPIPSQTAGLQGFAITYLSDDASVPKFVDEGGRALGVQLDANGRVLGLATEMASRPVPEPAGLALVMAALAGAALARRRRG